MAKSIFELETERRMEQMIDQKRANYEYQAKCQMAEEFRTWAWEYLGRRDELEIQLLERRLRELKGE